MAGLPGSDRDQALETLILTSPVSDLRSVLLSMLSRDNWEKQQLVDAFHSIHDYRSQKRQREADSTIHICLDCGEAFSTEENPKGRCISHPGEMELNHDSETWDDWDERCHGYMDSDDNKREYPRGFIWDCCDRVGDDPGCHTGRHVASYSTVHKKARTGSVSTDDDDETDGEVDEFDEETEEEADEM